MDQKLTPSTVLLLLIPPFLWTGNAIIGRIAVPLIPPLTLNFLRWSIALLIILPFGYSVLRQRSGLWAKRWRYIWLGCLGVGIYNSFQYLALHTSTPINVTLVTASSPVWMLLVGRLFFHTQITVRQLFGAVLSIAGVLIVLSHGEIGQLLELRFVFGDLLMLLATLSWAVYSWLLSQSKTQDSEAVRLNWATFMMPQILYGIVWSGAFAAGEWTVAEPTIQWGWPLALILADVSIGPAIIAMRCWALGVQRVGASRAGFFNNLAPLFAALMSSLFLGEMPQSFHAAGFTLIVGGIIFSSRR